MLVLVLLATACGRTTLEPDLSSRADAGGDLDAQSGDGSPQTGSVVLEVEPSRVCIGESSSVALRVRAKRLGTAIGTDIPLIVTGAEGFDVTPLTLLSTEETGDITITAAPGVSKGQHQLSFQALETTRTVEIDVGPAAGKPDTSFGTNGVVSAESGLEARVSLVIDGNDILVGNSLPMQVSINDPKAFLRRYDEAGDLDPSFAGDGVLELDYGLAALGLAKNGGPLVAPEGSAADSPAFLAFSPDGSNPVKSPMLTGVANWVRAGCIFEDEGGNVMLGGLIWDCCGFAARFSLGTSLDWDYWKNANAAIPGSGYACASASGGRFVHAGYLGMVRLGPGGKLDAKLSSATHRAISVAGDGRVVATTDTTIDSYSPAGAPDTEFGVNGQYAMSAQAVVVDRDGAVVALGQNELVRLTRFGSLDTAFASSTLELDSAALALDACGRIVTAGIAPTGNLEVRRFWP